MPLEENAKELVTINTHQGLYQFTRLLFGVASAPTIFQRTMDTILQGLSHVICYIDDILVTGVSEEEHLDNLEEVLKRFQHHGVHVKAEKCAFCQDTVEFLGTALTREVSILLLKKLMLFCWHRHPKISKSFVHFWVWYSTIGSLFSIFPHLYIH